MQPRRSPHGATWARIGLILVALLGVLGMHGLTANHDAVAMPHAAAAMAMPHSAAAHDLGPSIDAVDDHEPPVPSAPHHAVDLCLGILAGAFGLLMLGGWSRRSQFLQRRSDSRACTQRWDELVTDPLRRLALTPFELSISRT